MASPRPVPPFRLDWKGWNRRGRKSWAIPGPRSLTWIWTMASTCSEVHLDRRAFRAEGEGVLEEVDEHLRELARLSRDCGQGIVGLDQDPVRRSVRSRLGDLRGRDR